MIPPLPRRGGEGRGEGERLLRLDFFLLTQPRGQSVENLRLVIEENCHARLPSININVRRYWPAKHTGKEFRDHLLGFWRRVHGELPNHGVSSRQGVKFSNCNWARAG